MCLKTNLLNRRYRQLNILIGPVWLIDCGTQYVQLSERSKQDQKCIFLVTASIHHSTTHMDRQLCQVARVWSLWSMHQHHGKGMEISGISGNCTCSNSSKKGCHVSSENCSSLLSRSQNGLQIPTPLEGEGGEGQNQPVEFHFFLLGNPGIVIKLLKWNFKVTFLDKPLALVRKYLRLAPPELSASMMMATQFLEECHPYTCAAMVWNDEECWSLRKKISAAPPLKFHF